MTTIALYNNGVDFSHQPFDNQPETVEHYDFDCFSVQNGLPVARFRLRSMYMTPAYLEITMNELKVIICPIHWGERRLTPAAGEHIRAMAQVAFVNSYFFDDHCMYLRVHNGHRDFVFVGIDPIGNSISTNTSAVDKVWPDVLRKSDGFLRIKSLSNYELMNKEYPAGHLVTHGFLDGFPTTNLNPGQIGHNRGSNYALIHLGNHVYTMVIGKGMGLMDLVHEVICMNTDVKGVTVNNVNTVRKVLVDVAVDQLGWDKTGLHHERDYDGWAIIQRISGDSRSIAFRSTFELDGDNQGTVEFNLTVPLNDTRPMLQLIASAIKAKFNV